MVHASLFSGIGGFDLAASWMGWENAFYCEIDQWCRKILEYYFPDSKSYEDITKTDFSRWRGKIDVLSGGFPCQPFSVAGRRKGTQDNRYLWPQMLRVIRELQPTWIIGENVAGIASMVQPGEEVTLENQAAMQHPGDKQTICEQRFVIDTICTDLEREGYTVQPVLIPACALGAPHRRDRIWFIARHRTRANNYFPKRRENADTGNGKDFGENTSSHTTSERCHNGSHNRPAGQVCDNGNGYDTENQPSGYGRKYRAGKAGQTFADTLFGGRGEIFKEIQPGQPDGFMPDGTCPERDVAYTASQRLERDAIKRIQGRVMRFAFSYMQGCWQDFPSESPVCSANDGISGRLDGITFPKWRNNSIKAFGNAIVPQIAFILFEAIQEIEDSLSYN